jgi:hypothetical protein
MFAGKNRTLKYNPEGSLTIYVLAHASTDPLQCVKAACNESRRLFPLSTVINWLPSHVRYWHKADMPILVPNVRFRG